MNNTVVAAISFVAGAAIGAVVTMQYTKKQYERIAQEEIDSVKEVFTKKEKELKEKYENVSDKMESDTEQTIESEEEEYVEECAQYYELSKSYGVDDPKLSTPYVITPEEFGESEDYERYSLTYYADGILTDDLDKIIEDIEDTVGFDSLSHFGEFEDDSVFVRDDRKRCEYEILLDQRAYSEVLKQKPYLRE